MPVANSKTLVKNTLFSFISHVLIFFVSFLTTPYIVHKLGSDAYGLYTLTLALLGYFAYLEFGLNFTMVRYISDANARGDTALVKNIISTVVTLYLAIGIIGSVFLLLSTGVMVSGIFKIPSPLLNLAYFSFYITSLTFPFYMLSIIFGVIPRALQRMDLFGIVSFCVFVLQKLLCIFLLFLGFRLKAIMLVNLGAILITLVLFIAITKKLIPSLNLVPVFHRSIFNRLIKYSRLVFVGTVTSMLSLELNRFMIGSIMPIKYLSYYAIAYSIMTILAIIPTALVPVLYPAFSELAALNDNRRIKELYMRSSLYFVCISVLLMLIIFLFADKILLFWIGPEFALESTVALRILVVGYLFNSCTWPAWSISQGLGRPDIAAKTYTIQAVLNFIFCLILIPKIGINGAALASLINNLIGSSLIFYFVNRRVLKIQNREVIKTSYLKPVIVGLVILIIGFLIRNTIYNFFTLILISVFISILFFCLVFIFALKQEDRESIYSLFNFLRLRFLHNSAS